MMFLLQQEFT